MKKALWILLIVLFSFLASSELSLGNECDYEKYFTQIKTITIKLYFVRCRDTAQELVEVESVVPYIQSIGQAAILQLLEGPTEQERKRLSLDTAIPRGTRLNSIWIQDGIAHVDFSKELRNYGGGSARCLAIRAQIEETLKQFPTVKEVVITVEGKGESEGILQP